MTARRLVGVLSLLSGCLSLQPAAAQGVAVYNIGVILSPTIADSLAAHLGPFQRTFLGASPTAVNYQVSGAPGPLLDSLRKACGAADTATSVTACPRKAWLTSFGPNGVTFLPPEPKPDTTGSPEAVNCQTWGLCDIAAPAAWAMGATGYGVRATTLDTGVGPNIDDLTIIGGFDATKGDAVDLTDDNGGCDHHGSHTAGTEQGHLYGVAPEAVLWIEKVFSSTGSCLSYDGQQISALNNAVANGVRVVSVSIGGTFADGAYQSAIQAARAQGVVFCAANGNNGGPVTYPGGTPGAVGIAAIDQGGIHPSWSDTGVTTAFSAPGVNVVSDQPNNQIASKSGTSMATPHACGAFALLIGIAPKLSIDSIQHLFALSADNLGSHSVFGAGRIRPDKALALLFSTGFPTVSQPPIACQGTCSGCVTVSGTQPFQSLPTRSWVTTVDSVPQRKICYTANTALAAPGDSARVIVQGLGS